MEGLKDMSLSGGADLVQREQGLGAGGGGGGRHPRIDVTTIFVKRHIAVCMYLL